MEVKKKSRTEKSKPKSKSGSGSPDGKELSKRKRRKDETKDQVDSEGGAQGLNGEVTGPTGEEVSHSGVKDSKRKRKRKADEVENAPDRTGPLQEPEGGADAPTRGKLKRRRKAEDLDEVVDVQPLKKKKHRNRTDYPDPEDDSTLNDQAKRALMYAFAQFNRPSKWKFHKARQNWLLRNMFSNESIPETHMPLLTAYVKKIQGGVRSSLIKTCQSALEPPPVETPVAKDPPMAPANPTDKTEPISNKVDNIKMGRAKAILEALSPSE